MIQNVVLLVAGCLVLVNGQTQTRDPRALLPVNRVYVGLESALLANFSSFSGNSYVDNGMRKPAFVTKSFGLSLRQNLSRRVSLETGVSLLKLGYRATFTGNYRGGSRGRDKASLRSAFSLLEIPLRIHYYPRVNRSKLRKYVLLGTHLLYNQNAGFKGTVGGRGSFIDAYTGGSFSYLDRRLPSPRLTPTALVGIGVERELGSKLVASLRMVYCQGFTKLATWQTEYTTWDISQAVDAVTYQNTIVNKGSYIGLRLALQVAVF